MAEAPEKRRIGVRPIQLPGADVISPASLAARSESLPLRLSVARGALGVELTEPVDLEALVVEEMALGLLGVQFPVDLSKGVKQFRNRRAVLERLAVRLDFSALVPWVRELATPLFAEPIWDVRLQAHVGSALPEAAAEPHVSVVILAEHSALAFDLVFASGEGPRLVVDAARAFGLDGVPLGLALHLVDGVASRLSSGIAAVRREGRSLQVAGLARALCLRVLPDFGFRVPSVKRPLVQRIELIRGELCVVVDERSDASGVGRRGIQLGGLAEFTRDADDLLAQGDLRSARAAYLAALERAPKNREILAVLAALDLTIDGHAESALAFLEELGSFEATSHSSGLFELEGRALAASGRSETARESREKCVSLEPDAAVAALGATILANEREGEERLRWLDRAIERAPTIPFARRARMFERIRRGELRGALGDAEHGEASARSSAERAELQREVGRALREGGFQNEAISWLRRSLREEPDSRVAKLELGLAWFDAGEDLRALELVQSVVRRDEAARRDEGPAQSREAGESELVDQARWLAAQLIERQGLDLGVAIAHLRGVEGRSPWAARARGLEGRLALRLGDTSARLRAHQRLLEAIELGWISLESARDELVRVAQIETEAGQPELAARLRALLDAPAR